MEELLEWDESFQSIKTDEEVRALAQSNPAFFAPNVWPSSSMPELESAFIDVGKLVHEVGTMVAKCCDSYVSTNVSNSALDDWIIDVWMKHYSLTAPANVFSEVPGI